MMLLHLSQSDAINAVVGSSWTAHVGHALYVRGRIDMADEWYTPRVVFDALGCEFDLDVCSPKGGTGLVPAKRFYSIEDDALAQDWEGFVWMNPPYSKPTPFVDKFLAHNNGIALVPFSKSNWFINLWNSDAIITPLHPNIKFERPEGKPTQLFMQLALVALGDRAKEIITNSAVYKVR
jgi:hypothetical protein